MTSKKTIKILLFVSHDALNKSISNGFVTSKRFIYDLTVIQHQHQWINAIQQLTFDYYLLDEASYEILELQTQHYKTPPRIILITKKILHKLPKYVTDYILETEFNVPLFDKIVEYTKQLPPQPNQIIPFSEIGIPNRNTLNYELPRIIERGIRHEHTIALLLLDLDLFKQINDIFGHLYGDKLLKSVANRLKNNLRKVDYIFWLGGDEFLIVIEGQLTKEKIAHLASKLIHAIHQPFVIDEQQCQVSTSIGITFSDAGHMRSAEKLMKESHVAMYGAKKNGRNNFQFYESNFLNEFLNYAHLTDDLQNAIQNQELTVVYQPLVSFKSETIIGVEALLRWQHPTQGLIPPSVFIPIAEKTGFILSLGEWVLKEACLQRKIWDTLGLPPLLMAVNVSIFQLLQPNFVGMVLNILKMSQLEPKYLELEISESVITTNFEECAKKMRTLKKQGIHFVIDDFGTGYSNLGYLKHFPFDKIKIDKMFIDDISLNQREQILVDAIIDMAKKMGLDIVAEGVETLDQVNYLKQHHGLEVQGFYYSKPLSAKECTVKLKEGRAAPWLTTHQRSTSHDKQKTKKR